MAEVAGLCGVERGALAEDVPLTRYGVDSLGAVWLQHRVEYLFGVAIETTDLLARPTVGAVTEHVLVGLSQAPPPATSEVLTGIEEGVL